jgi:hypothetical protein
VRGNPPWLRAGILHRCARILHACARKSSSILLVPPPLIYSPLRTLARALSNKGSGEGTTRKPTCAQAENAGEGGKKSWLPVPVMNQRTKRQMAPPPNQDGPPRAYQTGSAHPAAVPTPGYQSGNQFGIISLYKVTHRSLLGVQNLYCVVCVPWRRQFTGTCSISQRHTTPSPTPILSLQ